MGHLQRTGGRPRRGAVQFRIPRRHAVASGALLLLGVRQEVGTKKQKMAVAQLGSARGSLFGAVKRMRVRWMAAAYQRALRRLSAIYAKTLEDLLQGAACVSTIHAQAGADCYFTTVVTVGGRY